MTLTKFSRLLTGDSEYQNAQYLLTRLHSRNVSAYDELSHILKIIAPVFSAEEYAAFLTEGSYISDELFLLGCLTLELHRHVRRGAALRRNARKYRRI